MSSFSLSGSRSCSKSNHIILNASVFKEYLGHQKDWLGQLCGFKGKKKLLDFPMLPG